MTELARWEAEFDHEWGVPNWRDESQYPGPSDLTPELWRWQFIRRMEDYREAWDRAAPIEHEMLAHDARGRMHVMPATARWFQLEFIPYRDVDTFWGLFRYLLVRYPNPRVNFPQVIKGVRSGLRFHDLHLEVTGYQKFAKEDGRVIEVDPITVHETRASRRREWGIPLTVTRTFDLTRPLGPQLDRAASSLKRLQQARGQQYGFLPELAAQERGRVRNEKWLLYLRVLDARAEAVTFDEIGRTLRQHDTRAGEFKAEAHKWHSAAMKVVPRRGAGCK